jgi:hypothetical protein
MAAIRILVLVVLLGIALIRLPAAQAQEYIDSGTCCEGSHVTWHGWSEDGWVHWQNDCYASGCTGWYIVSTGPYAY